VEEIDAASYRHSLVVLPVPGHRVESFLRPTVEQQPDLLTGNAANVNNQP